jgi:glycosyltransferase involved in cell wall biosynthesis
MSRVGHVMLKSDRPEGGIETFVAQAFLSATERGSFAHTAYCLRGAGEDAGTGSLRFAPLAWARLPDAAGKLLLTPWALWRARWRDRVSIVHFHGFGASVWAPLAKLLGLKVVAHSHGIEWERARWRGPYRAFLYAIARITCRWSDRTLVVSAREATTYAARFGVACRVVPGGFESHAAAVDLAAPRARRIVVAGRPVPEKRIAEAIEAWNAIPDHRGYELRVFCGGRYGGEYPDRIRRACEAARDLRWSGFVDREEFVRDLAGSSWFMALSSLEGRSLAMLEALATGNALVVADTPENREFIPDEGNRFAPAAADVPEIARLVEAVIGGVPPSPVTRERNAAAGRARSWADVRRDCEETYASV